MVSNNDIVETLELTSKLLELHGLEEAKIRLYGSLAYTLDRYKNEVGGLSIPQLIDIQGIGKSSAEIVFEIAQTGRHKTLDDLLEKTPAGVLEMFKIKGIGSKKIKVIWQDLGIDNLNDLQIACQNNRIAVVKGFGEKTETAILASLAFLQSQSGKLRMDKAAILADIIQEILLKYYSKVEVTGQIRRKTETVDSLHFLVNQAAIQLPDSFIQDEKNSSPIFWRGIFKEHNIAVVIQQVADDQFINKNFIYTAAEPHLTKRNDSGETLLQICNTNIAENETQIYETYGIPYIIPAMREGTFEFDWIKNHSNSELVTWESLKGILHNHSTYSDGKHSLAQMADFCKALGFEYLGIADHSQSATYAQGLYPNKVAEQHQEIEQLNKAYAADKTPFKILKGIESDILGNGSLDYTDDILATFDYVVASVHSNLTMSLGKATDRLLRAIENPYTTILGHPTGRLLLSREGYPIDYQVVIDACAHHKVVIEINASPYRLDLDWRWIQYALDKNVLLSINPDAHEMQGYFDMHYGVATAQKGGLTTSHTFNALNLSAIETYIKQKKTLSKPT